MTLCSIVKQTTNKHAEIFIIYLFLLFHNTVISGAVPHIQTPKGDVCQEQGANNRAAAPETRPGCRLHVGVYRFVQMNLRRKEIDSLFSLTDGTLKGVIYTPACCCTRGQRNSNFHHLCLLSFFWGKTATKNSALRIDICLFHDTY